MYYEKDAPHRAPANCALDCMHRAQMPLHQINARADLAVCVVCSPGYENQVAGLFHTLRKYGNLRDWQGFAFVADDDGRCEARLKPVGIEIVHVHTIGKMRQQIDASIKGVLYSAFLSVAATNYLCLDSDILISGDISSVPEMLKTTIDGKILAVRGASDMDNDQPCSIEYSTWVNYSTPWLDVLKVTGHDEGLFNRFVRLNAGLFAGSRNALMSVDSTIRAMGAPARDFIDRPGAHPAADELVWSFALARLGCLVELKEIYNLQFFARNAFLEFEEERAWFGDELARVLHFASKSGRVWLPQFRAVFCKGLDE